MSQPLLTADQVAARFQVSPKTVYNWARTGRIPAIRPSPGCVRFDPEAVEAFASAASAPQRTARDKAEERWRRKAGL